MPQQDSLHDAGQTASVPPVISAVPASDPAITAVRATLSAGGHDLRELLILSFGTEPRYVVVRYNPWGDTGGHEQDHCAAYARTLRQAGWARALDLESLVLVPDVPQAATEPGQYIATWQIAAEGTDPASAAAEARERQLDSSVTEALWTVTDHLGRTTTVTTSDEHHL